MDENFFYYYSTAAPLRSVAEDQEASEVQCVVVRELGNNIYYSPCDAYLNINWESSGFIQTSFYP